MNTDESDLTYTEAQSLALTALRERWTEVVFRLPDGEALGCAFGWVFTVDAETRAVREGTSPSVPTLVLVDKVSGQIAATSRRYTSERFGHMFERLLARSRANGQAWCVTLTAHLGAPITDIAGAARRDGLYQLKAGRDRGSI